MFTGSHYLLQLAVSLQQQLRRRLFVLKAQLAAQYAQFTIALVKGYVSKPKNVGGKGEGERVSAALFTQTLQYCTVAVSFIILFIYEILTTVLLLILVIGLIAKLQNIHTTVRFQGDSNRQKCVRYGPSKYNETV